MSHLILHFLINKFVDAVNEETKSNFPYKSMFLKIKDDLKQVSNWISNDPSILSEVKTEGPSALSEVKTDDPSALSKVKTDNTSALDKVNADKLRESMYSLDEILRECLMLSKKRKERGKICMNLYSPHELCTLRKFNERLQKIKQYLHGIRNNIPNGLGDSIHGGAPHTKEKRLQWTSSAIDETKIYGWDKDVEEINKELIEGTVLNKVGIVGMFGSGKSTLAQKIFVSEEVLDTFPLRLWVWVSPQCTEEELVRRMLDNLGVEEKEVEYKLEINRTKDKLGVLLFILYLQLLNNRYLIVFDDVENLDAWYCDLQAQPPQERQWSRLAHGLPKGNGSAIIITSRSEDDARMMVGQGKIYTPKPLIGDDGWALFRSAFQENGKTLTDKMLEECKHEIAIKCGGLPLALITAGKEMANMENTEAEHVKQEMSSQDENPIHDGEQAEKQKVEGAVAEEGSGRAVHDGEQAEKQKAEGTVAEGSSHVVPDGARAGKDEEVDDTVYHEGSDHDVHDGAQDEEQKEEDAVSEGDSSHEEVSGNTVHDGVQTEKQKVEDTVAEEDPSHTVGHRGQAEKQKAEDGAVA